MSLTYRIKRLIKSDINAWVDDLEDPRWVLAQAMRDMEEELERIEGAITAKESHLLKLKDGIANCKETTAKLDHDIGFAISEKREEIAKSFIRKQLVTQETLAAMTVEQAACAKEHSKMESAYRHRQESYERVRMRSAHLQLPQKGDDVFSSAERLIPCDQSLEHQVELEFLRRLQGQKNPKEVRHEKTN